MVVVASVLVTVVVTTTISEVVVVELDDTVESRTDEEASVVVVVASVVATVVSDELVDATGVVVVSIADVVVSTVVLDHGAQVSLFCSLSGLAEAKAKEDARTTSDLKCIFAIVNAFNRFSFLFVSFRLVINNRYRTEMIVVVFQFASFQKSVSKGVTCKSEGTGSTKS